MCDQLEFNPLIADRIDGRGLADFPTEQPSAEPLKAGSGACKACDCRGFRPTGKKNDVCAFCGHMWDRHW